MATTVAVSEETKRLLSTLKAKENASTYEDLLIKLVKKAYSEKIGDIETRPEFVLMARERLENTTGEQTSLRGFW